MAANFRSALTDGDVDQAATGKRAFGEDRFGYFSDLHKEVANTCLCNSRKFDPIPL